MEDVHIIVGLCAGQILPAVNNVFPQKSQVVLHVRFVRHISIFGVSIGLHIFFQKLSQLNKIVLKEVKKKKMPRLNNDERNQAIGMLNAGMSATVVSRHFWLYSKDYRAFTETIPYHRKRCRP